jgi:hypothetical protein
VGLTVTTPDGRTYVLPGGHRRELEKQAFALFGNAVSSWQWTGVYFRPAGMPGSPVAFGHKVKFRAPS